MTLADLLPQVHQLPPLDKEKLMCFLAEELDDPTDEDIAPLIPHKLYYMPIKYDAPGASRVLLDLLGEADKDCSESP